MRNTFGSPRSAMDPIVQISLASLLIILGVNLTVDDVMAAQSLWLGIALVTAGLVLLLALLRQLRAARRRRAGRRGTHEQEKTPSS